jgi:long-chain fatty acid transport protein
MRKLLPALLVALALPAAAQNVDIEALSGLQFNFGNPGARSLGMGGAFLGLADDASAAEANPAGLTILRKAEFGIEARNYAEQQILTTSGTFPEVERTGFTHHSDRVVVSFASAVIPIKKFTLGLYYHEPLNNSGAGYVIPQINELTGATEKLTPNFFLPAGGGDPISELECERLRTRTNNPAACSEFRVNPFISALDVRQRTFGLAAAYQLHPKFSVGATARYQTFREEALAFRFTEDFIPDYITAQATAVENGDSIEIDEQHDVTFSIGFKWAPSDLVSFGGVYKKGPSFHAPTFFASDATDWEYLRVAETTFHMPDTAGIGVSVRPRPELTLNFDVVGVKYSNLTDDFVAIITDTTELDEQPFQADDAVELHFGGEYFFPTRIPFAIRAGYWRDPAHSVEWRGPVNRSDYVAEAMLYPEGEAQNHYSIGAGLAWPRFQIDAAYETSDHYKVGSISLVTRF